MFFKTIIFSFRGGVCNMNARRIKQRFLVILAVVALAAPVSAFALTSRPDDEHSAVICYANLKVAEGDTLWGIASEYRPAGVTVQDYIKQIKKLNGLSSDVIYAGSFLIIPVEYSAEE